MSKPNVVVVMADDMGWGDLGCYGATKIPTPAMDRVAAEGVRATDCHSASAVCSPSRYALLTGRYAWRGPLKTWVLLGHSPAIIEADRPTLGSILQGAGYATGAFGKWHLGLGWHFRDGRKWNAFDPGAPTLPEVDDGSNIDYAAGFDDGPIARGFDHFFGITGSLDMNPYCFLEDDHTVGVPDTPKPVLHPAQRAGLMTPDWEDEAVDTRIAEEACSWIRAQADAETPFFCYVTPSAPHRPCVPPAFAQGQSEAGPRGDMVWMVDWLVGQITDLLDELELADNTLLIVTSDNGGELAYVDGNTYGHRTNGYWRGQKADIFEGGHREPFVARWPGHIPEGSVTDELFGLIDLAPTIAHAVGATVPEGAAEDATDVLDVLTGGAASPRSSMVHHSVFGVFSFRHENWKLILGDGSGGFTKPIGQACDGSGRAGQLYDLSKDPAEEHDLWASRPDVVAGLYEQIKRAVRTPASGLSFDVALDGVPRTQVRHPQAFVRSAGLR